MNIGISPTKFIIAFTVIDLSFLPMMRMGPIPFKLSFIIIFLYGFHNLYKKNTLRINKIQLMLLILIILLCLSQINRTIVYGLSESHRFFRAFLMEWVFSFLVYSAWKDTREIKIFKYLPLAYCIINLAFYQFIDTIPTFVYEFYHVAHKAELGFMGRNVGINMNPNISSMIGVLLCLLALMEYKEKMTFKLGCLILIPSFISCISFQSRTGLLAFFITIALFFKLFKGKKLVVTVIVAAVIIKLFLDIFLYQTIETTGYLQTLRLGNKIFMTRVLKRDFDFTGPEYELRKTALYLAHGLIPAKEFYYTGVGFDANFTFFKEDRYYPHNDYLHILVGLGAIGLFIYLLYIYKIMRIDISLIALFLFPSLTNSFIIHPQAFILLNIIVARVLYRKSSQIMIKNHSELKDKQSYASSAH